MGELLEQVSQIQGDGYTESSWKDFVDARDNAQTVYDDPNAMDKEIQEAYDALKQAIEGLTFAGDLGQLKDLVDQAHEIEKNLDKYLDLDKDDFKTFREALAKAEDVLTMTTPEQDVIDQAARDLTDAMLAMRLIPDSDALKDLLNKAQTVDRGQYTSASLSRLDNEIEKAKTVLSVENATQEQLNEAYTDLYQALNALERRMIPRSLRAAAPPTIGISMAGWHCRNECYRYGNCTVCCLRYHC